MEKQEQDFKLDYSLDWTDGVSIEQLKKDIEELEKLGATHVNIEHGISYDCIYVEIDAICRRIETDEEFEQRKKEFEARQEQYKQRELQQLADLKAKYGL
jgi:2-methylisocitrate lyase-like PEP mutase family enzyme